MAVKNVVLEDIVNTNTNVGFFAAPLNEHLGVAFKSDFDLARHRPSNLRVSNFVNEFLWADGLNIHGSYDQVLIDRYHVGEAGDDCIALWSHKDLLGAVTIQNSYAGKCGYMGCYAVYGGSGPLVYINNTCAGRQPPDWAWGSHHCLWLNDQFNGQFSSGAHRITGKGWQCNGWTCDGSARDRLCPASSGAPWGHCDGTYPYETGLCRAGNR
mmetsp:Transcript_3657/g.11202  ORF Transcript_3657/g.11202 Transcript_3657/m.11202 type:complete len:212 (-) Transcript_3657:371-1006(-)